MYFSFAKNHQTPRLMAQTFCPKRRLASNAGGYFIWKGRNNSMKQPSRKSNTPKPSHDTPEPFTAYREVKIGNTLYRVTSVFVGEKDLVKTLEDLAVRKAMLDIRAGLKG